MFRKLMEILRLIQINEELVEEVERLSEEVAWANGTIIQQANEIERLKKEKPRAFTPITGGKL
jgi:hypothetical protein